MASFVTEKIYNMALISKIKEQTGSKQLKKTTKKLRNLAEEDLKQFSGLKIKVFQEEKKEEKIPEIIIAAPIFGFRQYVEDFKKPYSKKVSNNNVDYEGENTPSTVNDNEENQIDSSDFSADE